MGYAMKMMECTTSIDERKKYEILECLREYMKRNNPNWGYLNMSILRKSLKESCKKENFEEVMENLRYQVINEDGKYKLTFVGESFGSDDEILNIISPYMNDGYIEMLGEEGEKWRWVFKDGKMAKKHAVIKWE